MKVLVLADAHTMHTSTVTMIRVIMERTTTQKFATPTQAVLRLVGQIAKIYRNITTDILFFPAWKYLTYRKGVYHFEVRHPRRVLNHSI
jgi:hypothetical protein